MTFGNLTPQDILELVEAKGCPACEEHPSQISLVGRDATVPNCGHLIDAKE